APRDPGGPVVLRDRRPREGPPPWMRSRSSAPSFRSTVPPAARRARSARSSRLPAPSVSRPTWTARGTGSRGSAWPGRGCWSGVTIGYKGNLSLVLRFEGERSHLSSPEGTTVEVGLAFLDRLRAFVERRRDESGFRSLGMKVHSIHTVREGSAERVEIGVNL